MLRGHFAFLGVVCLSARAWQGWHAGKVSGANENVINTELNPAEVQTLQLADCRTSNASVVDQMAVASAYSKP